MSHTIHIQINRADGSLLRLIGLVERRGFEIHGMDMKDLAVAAGGEWRTLALTVASRDGTRCIDNLGRQIDRLFGVRRLEAHTTRNVQFIDNIGYTYALSRQDG